MSRRDFEHMLPEDVDHGYSEPPDRDEHLQPPRTIHQHRPLTRPELDSALARMRAEVEAMEAATRGPDCDTAEVPAINFLARQAK